MTHTCEYCENKAICEVDGEHLCEECSAFCNETKQRYHEDDTTSCKWCEETYHNDFIDDEGVCCNCQHSYYEEMNAEHPSLTARERNL